MIVHQMPGVHMEVGECEGGTEGVAPPIILSREDYEMVNWEGFPPKLARSLYDDGEILLEVCNESFWSPSKPKICKESKMNLR